MKTRIFISTIALYFVCSISCLAQSDCYTNLFKQGSEALANKDYEGALRSFNSIIRNCSNLRDNQRDKVLALIDETFRKNRADLEEKAQLAEDNAEKARQNARKAAMETKQKEIEALHAQSSKLAYFATEETDVDAKLALAYYAKNKIEQLETDVDDDPFAKSAASAFGSAVQAKFSRLENSDLHYCNDACILDDGTVVQAIKGQIKLIKKEKGPIIIEAHNDHITSIATADHLFITASKDHKAKIWTAEGMLKTELAGHQDDVNGVVFNPNATRCLSFSRDQTAILWNLEGKQIAKFKGHLGNIYEAQFSPDGLSVITRSEDNTVRIWNLSGTEQAKLSHDGHIYDFTISSHSGDIVTTASNQTIKWWDKKGKLKKSLTGHQAPVIDVEFSSDGSKLLSRDADNQIILWDRDQSKIKQYSAINSLSNSLFVPGKNQIVISEGFQIKVMDYAFNEVSRMEHDSQIDQLLIAPGGAFLLSGSTDQSAKMWDFSGVQLLSLDAFESPISGLAFSKRNDQLLAYSQNGKLAICPSPQVVYQELTKDPPKISKELKAKYGL